MKTKAAMPRKHGNKKRIMKEIAEKLNCRFTTATFFEAKARVTAVGQIAQLTSPMMPIQAM